MEPTRPRHFPEHAERCLDALVAHDLGHQISLGGAFGLLHYLDYRSTHDVDAWWRPTVSPSDRRRVVQVLEDALASVGEVRTREWGQVVSVELSRGSKKIFSFQIAERTVQLEPSAPAPWGDVLLDDFRDLLASKMVALVERGAPRDLRDVYAVCRSELATPVVCWNLWRERQEKAGLSAAADRARLAVETHLARITTHRPLDSITDPGEREAAATARSWYKKELLDALVD